jgi:hypothetical protein
VRRTDLIRSATFRLGLLATIFFVCSIAVVYSLTYIEPVAQLTRPIMDRIGRLGFR